MLYSVIAELFLKCIWHLYSLGKFKHWKNYFFQMYVLKVIISSVPLSVWSGYFPCVKLTPNHKGDEMLFVFLSDLQIAVRFLLLSFWKHFSCFCLQQHSEGKSPQSPIGQLFWADTWELTRDHWNCHQECIRPWEGKIQNFPQPQVNSLLQTSTREMLEAVQGTRLCLRQTLWFCWAQQCPDLAIYVTFQFP